MISDTFAPVVAIVLAIVINISSVLSMENAYTEVQPASSDTTTTPVPPSFLRYQTFANLFKDCQPRNYESTMIECSAAASSNFTSSFYGECLDKGVIRLVGEFDIINISCSAPFHLDFDFDGFQPTEAIKVTTWKQLGDHKNVSSKVISRYHLELKIYSTTALFRRHHPNINNASELCPGCKRHDYPRTGNHIVHDMFNSSVAFPVYFFFEEKHLDAQFLFNNYTRVKLGQNGDQVNLYVPCRTSHATVPTTLSRILNDGTKVLLLDGEYRPWKGFRIPVSYLGSLNSTEKFECASIDGQVPPLVLRYPPDPEMAFGFDKIFLQPPRNNKVTLNHEANPITRDPITVNITCVIQTDDKHPYMGSIGCDNPTHIRLVREFILREYGDMSYTRRNTTTLVGDNFPQELKIYRNYQTGITYCVSQSYSRIYEYAAGLNRVMYQLDFGTDYTTLPHTSPPKEVHIHLELLNPTQRTPSEVPNSVKLIIDYVYNFSCRIDMFTVARTILWEMKFKNGTRERVKVDYNFPGEYSYYSFRAAWTVAKISCSAVFWNNDKWRTDELDTIVGYEETEMDADTEENLIIGSTALVILMVILGTAMFFSRKLNRRNKWKFSNLEVAEFERGNPSVKKETAISEGGQFLPYDKSYEIEEKNFTIDWDRMLGSGEFGTVFKGTVYESRDVAIKMVKPDMDKAFTKALLSELKIMIYLGRHENVLELVGAYTSKLRQGTVYLFLEFCPLGSLESYLRKNRHHLQPNYESSPYTQFSMLSPDEFELSATAESMMSMKDLYTWCHQIAQGMDYLSNKQVIHGDLATRNVLLDENKTAKICDFGLSRRLHNYKFYMKNSADSTPLPWPWMAPEALQTLTFSSKTDVWSFGITVWEIFSLGQVPYPGMHCGIDFINRLREGMRNLRPKLAPLDLYKEVMKECWRYHPEDRPTFNELCFLLESMLAAFNSGDSRNMSVSSDSGIASTAGSGYVQHQLTFTMGM